MRSVSVGEQELAVLRFIADHAPVPAREVIDRFAGEQELARTTVLTKIERLRKKGLLTRKRRDGIYYYSPRVPQGEVIQSLVRDFIEKTLGGSVSPLVTYLLNTRELTEEEAALLRRLSADLPDDG